MRKVDSRFMILDSGIKSKSLKKGFTLIESLIYIALLGVILGSFLATAYQIISHTNTMREKIFVLEETNFLLKKISFLLNDATSVSSPSLGRTGPILLLHSNAEVIKIAFNGEEHTISLKRNSSSEKILNSDFVTIDDLSFDHVTLNGKEIVKVHLTIKDEEFIIVKLIP